MARTRGAPKTGGRQKGTPNKITSNIKEWLQSLLEEKQGRFARSLNNVSDSEFVKVYSGLLNYVIPKQHPISAEELVKAEYEEISKLIDNAPEEFVEKIASKIVEYQAKYEQGRTKSND